MSFGIYLVGYIILIAGLAMEQICYTCRCSGSGWAFSFDRRGVVHGWLTATRQKDPQS